MKDCLKIAAGKIFKTMIILYSNLASEIRCLLQLMAFYFWLHFQLLKHFLRYTFSITRFE